MTGRQLVRAMELMKTLGISSSRLTNMAKKFPLHPKHPERICWGCDKYCPVDSLGCGNGADRTQHPAELLGDDWMEYGDWVFDLETVEPTTTDPA